MGAIMFDSLTYSKKLQAVGVPPEVAEVQALALAEVIDDRLATKDDINNLRSEVMKEIDGFKTDIKKDMEALRVDVKRDMDIIRKEMQFEMKTMEGRLDSKIQGLSNRVDSLGIKLTFHMGSMITAAIAILGALHMFFR